jgi:UDP-N-acetylglucosamine 3-dehydrogenase
MLNVGVIGIGGMGKVHIDNIGHIDFAKVTAICDISPLASDKAKEIGAVLYNDIDKMLVAEKLDAVCVCTPTFMHYDHIKKVISKGVHVITEKPLALKSKQAIELFDIANKNKVMLFVAHVLRFWTEYALLRDIIKDKRYGEVLDAEFLRLTARPQWIKGGWLFDVEKSGHIPFDLHIHDLDFIVSLFGKPKDYSFAACGNKDKPYKEHYRFLYQYENMTVSAQASWYNADIPFTASYRVYFENAIVEYDGDKMMAYSFDFDAKQLNEKEELKIETGINVPATGAYYSELVHFLGCIKQNKPSDMFKQQELLAVIEILEDINKA